MGRTARERLRNIQLGDLGVVTGEDAVTDGEAGVGGDDAVVSAGDGHARAAVVLVRVEPRHRLCSRDSVVCPHSLATLLVCFGGGRISSENSEARSGKGKRGLSRFAYRRLRHRHPRESRVLHGIFLLVLQEEDPARLLSSGWTRGGLRWAGFFTINSWQWPNRSNGLNG